MFEILWLPEPLDELTPIWTQAVSGLRSRITQASAALEQMLALDPIEASESRIGATRVAFSAPLGVLFQVDETERRI